MYGFLFRSEFFFRTTQELEYFFSQNLTLGYMTKTLNQIFFSSTKIRIFFSATFQVKWSFPYDVFLVFFYVFWGKSMDRTFLSVGSPFIEEGGKMT